MSDSKKIESICAFEVEPGLLGGSNWAYNGSSIATLGANDGLTYLSKSPQVKIETREDDSIDGGAFKGAPVQVGIEAPLDNFETITKYQGIDHFLYWLFGYEDGGSSPVDLTGGDYSHLFELDMHERHFAPYRSNEDTAGDYDASDRKNRTGTFAFKMGPNDHRYKHQMCTGFSFRSSADDGQVICTAKGVGPKQERGDYGSANWTYVAALQNSDLNVLHRHQTVSIAPAGGGFVAVGVESWEINVDWTLNVKRDTTSGLYMIEPMMEGFYSVSASITLSRHGADTYPGYRDAWTTVLVKIVAASGDYGAEWYLPNCKIQGNPSEDEIPNLPLTLTCGKEVNLASPVFATEIGATHDLLQGGPLFMIMKNKSGTNEMRRA